MPTAASSPPVHVIGGGPGGLAAAAALQRHGLRTLVLERGSGPGTSWRAHYDRLRLHTTRRWSGLPGLPIPRSAGRWVSRDDFVRYLEQYCRHHRLEVATGVEVARVDRVAAPEATAESETGRPDWRLTANGGRVLHAPAVVVATGYNHTPYLPPWPGRDGFTGEMRHAHGYRDGTPYRGLDVLVVGAGNTGAEIAADLADTGAGRVRLAVRTPPHIVRRSTLGWPAQASGVLTRRLPVPVVDRLARPVTGLLPDLTAQGLPRPAAGLAARVREGAIPVQDVGLVRAVRRGAVEPVAAVESFDGGTVRLADGTAVRPDVVIAATGYRRGLEELVGHLGVLDGRGLPVVRAAGTHPDAPGLRFTGYANPLSGMLREIAREAPRVAAATARELGRRRRRARTRRDPALPRQRRGTVAVHVRRDVA